MRLGYSMPEIAAYFDDLIKHSSREKKNTEDVPYGGQMQPVDVYEVPLDLPRYRLNNTRTIALQEQYIASKNLSSNYFESDPLSDKLQEIQHNILTTLIQRKGLKEYFEDNQQTRPFILTHDGFVISGNRRLCAFRELYYSTSDGSLKYKRFERVRVAILPKLSEEEIEHIEDYFEQQPDIQDEFSWTSRALGFKKRLEKYKNDDKYKKVGYDITRLAENSNIKKSIVEGLLNKLSVAEEYLEYIGRQKQYELIETDEFAFDKILKGRRQFEDDPGQKEIFQRLSFLTLKNQEQISDRMYNNIPIIQESLEQMIGDIQTSYFREIQDIQNKTVKRNPLSDLDDEVDRAHPILRIIDNKSYEENILGIIQERVAEYRLLKQDRKREEAVLKKLQKAHQELAEANNMINEKTKKEGIPNQLANIEKEITKLKIWLGNGAN